ncbi:MAG: hypothetical protein ABMB14_15690 [Myxococcota bacterium]
MFRFAILAIAAVACSDDAADTVDSGSPTTADPSQVPPQGYAAIDAWIQDGVYEGWHCQADVHPPSAISPHGPNRICSNDAASGHGDGEYPVGAASVKELYDSTSTTIVGYAVATHVTAGTSGDTWYWYEQVPPGTVITGLTIDANGVVADGLGDSGQAMTLCVSCHAAAGADATHPGHDMVYVQVSE